MEKRRSIGVFIFGLYFIILSFVGLFQFINHFQLYAHFGVIYVIFAPIYAIAFLFCGIFILKLNPVARQAVIILSLLNILIVVLMYDLTPAVNQLFNQPMPNHLNNYEQQRQYVMKFKPEYQKQALEKIEKNEELTKKTFPVFMKVMFVIFFWTPLFLFNLIPIYFFTRPKVKEQFT